MKRFLWIFSVMTLVAALVFIIGCSDDDESTSPVVKETGDPDALELEGASFVAGVASGMNGEMLGFMYDFIDYVFDHPDYPAPKSEDYNRRPDGPSPLRKSFDFMPRTPLDSFYLTYHEDSEYWYAHIQAVDTETVDTFMLITSVIGEDSVQFLHGTQVVQWPDSAQVTGIDHGTSLTVHTNGWLESVEAHQLISITGDICGYGDIIINGASSVDADVNAGNGLYCMFDIDLDCTLDEIMLNMTELQNDGCPTSGTLRYTGMINMSCTGDTSFTHNDNWSVTQTFDGTIVHNVVENSTTRWEFDEVCGGGATVSENRMPAIVDHLQ